MQFLVIGLDGKDEGAVNRRLGARPDHIQLGNDLLKTGNFWYGAALTDENGTMIGSMLLMDFESREALDQWLADEPYVTKGVWKEIQVHSCSVRDPWMFNRP